MAKVVEFYIEKNVMSYPNASYSDYWRLARSKDESLSVKISMTNILARGFLLLGQK